MIPTLNFIHSGALKLAIERSRDLREFFAPTIFPLIVMARAAVARDSSSHGPFIYITIHDASLEQDHVGDSAEREPAIALPPNSTGLPGAARPASPHGSTGKGHRSPASFLCPGRLALEQQFDYSRGET
jgi:hypothetical protein